MHQYSPAGYDMDISEYITKNRPNLPEAEVRSIFVTENSRVRSALQNQGILPGLEYA